MVSPRTGCRILFSPTRRWSMWRNHKIWPIFCGFCFLPLVLLNMFSLFYCRQAGCPFCWLSNCNKKKTRIQILFVLTRASRPDRETQCMLPTIGDVYAQFIYFNLMKLALKPVSLLRGLLQNWSHAILL